MIFYDTETCGLHGPTVLIQYAVDDGPIFLHSVWEVPIQDTLVLIEEICSVGVVGFNLAFDHFHLAQTYTTLLELAKRVGYDKLPIDYVNEYAECEAIARDGPCIKPKTALDLMLHARKGPYQSTMDRKDIVIRRVPSILAKPLATELEKRIPLKDIYFARRKDKHASKWQVYPIKLPDGTYHPDLRNVVLKFKPSAALKVLAADALGEHPDDILLFVDVMPKSKPVEAGWAPYAKAISSKDNDWKATVNKKKGYAWPALIYEHISHWSYNTLARTYAEKDVDLTRKLYHHFGRPDLGDNDSILACMVGAVRWKGFAINILGIQELKKQAQIKSKAAPKAPKKVFNYLSQVLSPEEQLVLHDVKTNATTTKRIILETLAKWKDHPVAPRAQACLDARKSQKEIEIYDKLLQAGRFHASFKIIGTLSSRMSGSDGLNPQGIKHDKYVRKMFPLAFAPLELCGGDFSSFEVSIADADYNDQALREQLCTCAVCKYVCTIDEFRQDACPKCGKIDSRRKIHGLFGMQLSPGTDYDGIIATKGSSDDLYDKGKRGVFSQLYGGNYQTMMNKLGIEEEIARQAEKGFATTYPGVGLARQKISDMFCSMKQPGGIGSNVEWHEPSETIESLTGFARYFTLENQICRVLFNLGNKIPQNWKNMKIKVIRRDRDQTVGGAVMSALFGAAFQIQAAVMRAAANHRIQSTGATLTKDLQRRIWELQPVGVHEWHVQPFNCHDEIMCPSKHEIKPKVTKIVRDFVEETKILIPLIKIDWAEEMNNWSEK